MPRRTSKACSAGAVCLIGTTGATAQTTMLYSTHAKINGAFGQAVAAGPDADGDGLSDVIVGAPKEDVGPTLAAGRVTVHASGDGQTVRVFISPDFQKHGWFGSAVASVPDVNGDGKADWLVGAPNEGNENDEFTGRGRVYIFSGSAGALLRVIKSPNEEAGGHFGAAVAGLADINGDGSGDVVIGAPNEDPGNSPSNCGRVYVISGKTGAVIRAYVAQNQQAGGVFGEHIAVVPDANGDGKADLAVSAVGMDVNGVQDAGRVYLFNGAEGGLLRSFASPFPQASGFFGTSVAGVRDVNGDARGDLIVGAPYEDLNGKTDAGRAYLFNGATGALIRAHAPGVSVAGDYFGFGVAGLSDINGDGRGDVAIGAPLAGAADDGRVFIYLGATGSFLRSLSSPNPGQYGEFGIALAPLPDINDNARTELIVGAPFENTAKVVRPGRAYIIRN
jgi:hypothetical protein